MNTTVSNYCKVKVIGVVQSVGFRPFIKNLADSLNLKGYVRNMADAGVEIVILGTFDVGQKFLEQIRINKPELSVILQSNVSEINIDEIIDHKKEEFTILKSSTQKTSGGISPLPPDISCCDDCINDLNTPRRNSYGFISCTNCGPRFTAIRAIPYDRYNTAFNNFPLCDACNLEYTNPKDRRFHAQTTCCKNCGPQFSLYMSSNNWGKIDFNIKILTSLLEKGALCGMMGSGGSHLVADALNVDRVTQLRREKRKLSDKPFAVMMRDIETVSKYCDLTEEDKKLLLSVRRPIVVLPTKERDLWSAISPKLSTLGVMLPYTSFHHVLFNNTSLDVLLMTSANQPQVPMPIKPDIILHDFKKITDAILVHNRPIIQRIDDSVIRSFGSEHRIIRRSRGFVPQPIFHKDISNINAVSFGAEENCTAAIAKDGWIVPTQHIGHVSNIENYNFMEESINHLLNLYSLKPSNFVSDLHPTFLTTELAQKFAKLHDGEFYQIQHHAAHVASLGVDKQIPHDEPLLAWACDGFGMSPDRKAWGCELILINEFKWERKGSTTPLNYSGGDQNAIYPARMLLEYLKASESHIPRNLQDHITKNLKNKDVEYSYVINSTNSHMTTTSLARLLDSISALLGISTIRSYRGEPAIKLEDVAMQSTQNFNPQIEEYITNGKVKLMNTIKIFEDIYSFSKTNSKSDTARFTHEVVAKTMAAIGEEISYIHGVNHLGFTGGVAYNKLINNFMKSNLDPKLSFLSHENIPCGDAGISVGQLNYLSMMLKRTQE